MDWRTLPVTLFICITTLIPQTLVADTGTRELRREIIKLHGDISMSAGNLLLLSQQHHLNRILSDSDDATVLAALEALNRNKFIPQDSGVQVGQNDIRTARNKIEIYKMLCMSAKSHEKIFSKYCSPPPFQDLYASYRQFAAKQ